MGFGKTIITKVFDVYGYDNATKKLVLTSHNLTKGGVKNTQNTEEIRNGEANSLWGILYSDKTTTVSLSENTFNLDEIAVLAGSSVVSESSVDVYTEEFSVVASNTNDTVTLPSAPIPGAVLNVAINGVLDSTASADSTTLTVKAHKAGDLITVYPYLTKSKGTVDTLNINMDDVPKSMTLVAKTKELSSDMKVVGDIEFIFPNAIPTGEWSIDTTSQVQANEQSVDFKILQIEGSKSIYKIHRIPKTQG